MHLTGALMELVFLNQNSRKKQITQEDLQEYILVKQKKSKLSANDRRNLVAFVNANLEKDDLDELNKKYD